MCVLLKIDIILPNNNYIFKLILLIIITISYSNINSIFNIEPKSDNDYIVIISI